MLSIDPSCAVNEDDGDFMICGFFPQDIPSTEKCVSYELIITRHMAEHIENPRTFVASLVDHLTIEGELWVEVPDRDAAISKGLWSNFYQLHCNYFSAESLDVILSLVSLKLAAGESVADFGGSILRRYSRGGFKLPWPTHRYPEITARVAAFRQGLARLARQAPAGTTGYGAAERTAATLDLAPELIDSIPCLYDGNRLLEGRFLAGTKHRVGSREEFILTQPPSVLLFALSTSKEILEDWKRSLPLSTMVSVVGLDDSFCAAW